MYNNKMLQLEKNRVVDFINTRALEKNYPQQYLQDLMPLLEQMYDICILPNTEIQLLGEVTDAFNFAKEKHIDQMRRFVNLPYIIHPLEMASRLSLEGFSHEAIMGALLHDVVEDCGVALEEIKSKYGSKVEYYVYYLSDIALPEEGNRATRLEINFKHFQQSDWVNHNIKLTDLISNTRSLVLCDPRFAQSYVSELLKGMPYFEENKQLLNNNLYTMLEKLSHLSERIVNLQNQYKIPKLESKKNKGLSI